MPVTVLVGLGGAVMGALAGGLLGLLAGGAIGLVLGQQLDLRKRLKKIEETQSQVAEMQSWAAEMKVWAKQTHAWLTRLGPAAQPAEAQPEVAAQPDLAAQPEVAAQPDLAAEPGVVAEPAVETREEPEPAAGVAPVVRPAAAESGAEVRAAVPSPARAAPPDPSTRALQTRAPAASSPPAPGRTADREQPSDPISWLVNWIKQWVTTGNAPVKVGVLVSLVGVGLLLREVHRRGIIELTIEVRLVAAAVFGLVLLAIGWRQRRIRPVYGLSLQGGGIAVLYVTTYAAFAVYDVLPAVPAASAVVVVTLGAGVLSVLQDSRPLAVLGIIGGFLAPVLTYSRPEDHVLVFSFFVVLNAAILGVAWFKVWPELNLLGFGFTFGLTAFWLANRYEQDEWVSTQPFIALFVLMYVAMPALFAVREAPVLKRAFDASRAPDIPFEREVWTAPLVFGTPFIGLGLQQLAIGHTEYGLAITAAGLAGVQGALALATRRLGVDRRPLAESYAALAVAFSAIAVPFALDSYFASTVWAVQGLMLMWLGCRRGRLLALSGGARAAGAGCVLLRRAPGGLPPLSDGHSAHRQPALPGRAPARGGRLGVGMAAQPQAPARRARSGHRLAGAGLGNRLVAGGRAHGDHPAPGRQRRVAGVARVRRGFSRGCVAGVPPAQVAAARGCGASDPADSGGGAARVTAEPVPSPSTWGGGQPGPSHSSPIACSCAGERTPSPGWRHCCTPAGTGPWRRWSRSRCTGRSTE